MVDDLIICCALFEQNGDDGVAFFDVAERKSAKEALRCGEAWLAQAQRLSHTGTWVMNGDNEAFSVLVGRELPDLGA